jgi:hypothetical protein
MCLRNASPARSLPKPDVHDPTRLSGLPRQGIVGHVLHGYLFEDFLPSLPISVTAANVRSARIV